MVSEGDTTTTEIDGIECDVTVESVNLEQKLLDDIEWLIKAYSDIEVRGETLVVEPSMAGATWLKSEFRDINESDWRIVDVENGEYGPRIHLRHDD